MRVPLVITHPSPISIRLGYMPSNPTLDPMKHLFPIFTPPLLTFLNENLAEVKIVSRLSYRL